MTGHEAELTDRIDLRARRVTAEPRVQESSLRLVVAFVEDAPLAVRAIADA